MGVVEVDSLRGDSATSSRGSAVLFALIVCLGMAVAVQAVTLVVLCARGALEDESRGRKRVEQTEEGLFALRDLLAQEWRPRAWAELDPSGLPGTEGLAAELEGSEDWAMVVSAATDVGGVKMPLTAWVEKGRDGVDLPIAALVAGRLTCSAGRASPWLEAEPWGDEEDGGPTAAAVGYLAQLPSVLLVGENCEIRVLGGQWGFDEAWRAELGRQEAMPSMVEVVSCEEGQVVPLPAVGLGTGEDKPVLVIALGGGVLDARNAGEIWGVLVVDEGSLLLEGTTLNGAAIVSREVDFGATGVVEYAASVLAWARESSLMRIRLVPGSRREGME